MTISRSQIERQLREGGGIMEVVPREEAFLGGIKKAIKKVTKAVKNVAKSPVGKAAMLYFAPMAFGQTSGGLAGYRGLFDKVSPAFSNLLKARGTTQKISGVDKALGALKVGTAVGGLAGLAAAVEQGDEDAIQATTNVESLKKYLYSSYENLGYDPQEIPALVQRDVSEYTAGQGGYATGGRVRYQQGSGIGSLGGGSQTTPTTGKASYAEGPQLYRDLIDYLQIEGPKPEMVNSEMMMNDVGGGAMPAYGGSGSSGGTTGSSITSGSTGGGSGTGSGTGILQATPGTTQPTNTPPSNVAPTTTAAPTVSTSKTSSGMYIDPTGTTMEEYFARYTPYWHQRMIDELKDTYGEENKLKSEAYRKAKTDFDYSVYKAFGFEDYVPEDYVFGDINTLTKDIAGYNTRMGYAKGTKMASADNPFFRSDYADEHSYRMFGKPYKELTASELEEFREEMERLRNKFMADGGRVNYAEGTKENLIIPKKPKFQTEEEVNATTLGRAEIDDPMPGRLESAKRLKGVMQLYDRLKKMAQSGEMSNKEEAMALFNKRMKEESENLHFLDKEKLQDYIRKNRAYGGRMEYAMGSPEDNARKAAGIMDLPLNENKAGVTELDLRETGGFIPPVGVKEKADDIPAMLSNNEFVFTADAVRGMGNGDVNVGAQRMYDMMKKLENGGRV